MSPSLSELQQALLDSPTGEARAKVAKSLAESFATGEFNANEKDLAGEIFRLLVNDAEVLVRKMLSEQLASCMDAPHDVILKLAKDIAQVSLPVLEHSFVLTEDELVAITRSTDDTAVTCAIARRETVSRELSQALIDKSNKKVTETLLFNKGANIDERSLNAIYAANGSDGSIMEIMVKRGGLPVSIAEKIYAVVSDEYKRVLTSQYKLSMQIADESSRAVREIATLGLIDPSMKMMDIAQLVEHLHKQGKLTPSIIIRSLCGGDIRFFAHSMAILADTQYNNAQLLLLDQSDRGFKSLFKASCLPMELFGAMHHMLKAVLEETSFGRYQYSDIKQRLVSRLVRDKNVNDIPYMEYLYTLISNRESAMAS